MKRIFDFFRRAAPLSPPERAQNGGGFRIQSHRFDPAWSSPEGDHTFLAGDKAVSAMQELTGLALDEMAALPARVLAKCRELGFAHNEPVHFLFDAQEFAHPVWTANKITPPLDLAGVRVERAINIYVPTLREEIESKRNEIGLCVAMARANHRRDKEREYLADAPKAIKAKYQMLLTHEMVHVFATDEYREVMQVLGLDLLELLTDSINLVTFYRDIRKAGVLVKAGAAEGIAYLVNLLRAEHPGKELGPDILDLAHERAKKIIAQCREKYAAAQRQMPAAPVGAA